MSISRLLGASILVTALGLASSGAQGQVRDPIAGPWEQIEAKNLTTGVVAPHRVSTTNDRALARAREAVWSRDGRELFYRHGSQMMSVRVPAGQQQPDSATVLFEGDYFAAGGPGIVNYDVASDGRFLMLKGSRNGPRISAWYRVWTA
jgi:hypothetical protein